MGYHAASQEKTTPQPRQGKPCYLGLGSEPHFLFLRHTHIHERIQALFWRNHLVQRRVVEIHGFLHFSDISDRSCSIWVRDSACSGCTTVLGAISAGKTGSSIPLREGITISAPAPRGIIRGG